MLIYIIHEIHSNSKNTEFSSQVVNVFLEEEIAVLCVRMFNKVPDVRYSPFRYYDVFDTQTQRYVSFYNLFPQPRD